MHVGLLSIHRSLNLATSMVNSGQLDMLVCCQQSFLPSHLRRAPWRQRMCVCALTTLIRAGNQVFKYRVDSWAHCETSPADSDVTDPVHGPRRGGG